MMKCLLLLLVVISISLAVPTSLLVDGTGEIRPGSSIDLFLSGWADLSIVTDIRPPHSLLVEWIERDYGDGINIPRCVCYKTVANYTFHPSGNRSTFTIEEISRGVIYDHSSLPIFRFSRISDINGSVMEQKMFTLPYFPHSGFSSWTFLVSDDAGRGLDVSLRPDLGPQYTLSLTFQVTQSPFQDVVIPMTVVPVPPQLPYYGYLLPAVTFKVLEVPLMPIRLLPGTRALAATFTMTSRDGAVTKQLPLNEPKFFELASYWTDVFVQECDATVFYVSGFFKNQSRSEDHAFTATILEYISNQYDDTYEVHCDMVNPSLLQCHFLPERMQGATVVLRQISYGAVPYVSRRSRFEIHDGREVGALGTRCSKRHVRPIWQQGALVVPSAVMVFLTLLGVLATAGCAVRTIPFLCSQETKSVAAEDTTDKPISAV